MKHIKRLFRAAAIAAMGFTATGCVFFSELNEEYGDPAMSPNFSTGGLGAGYTRSTVDIGRVGFGTVVNGTSEDYLVQSDSSIDREGFSLGGYHRLSPRIWGFATYEYAEGDSRASASVSEGGSTDHGLTYLGQYTYSGGSSTGIFAGNSYGLEGSILTNNSWSAGHIGLATHVPLEGGSYFTGALSLFVEDFEQDHEARVDATLGGVALGDLYQVSRVELQDDYLGLSFDGSVTIPIPSLGGSSVTFGGYGQFAQRDGSGRAWQMTDCGPCGSTSPVNSVTQNFAYSEDDTSFNFGLRVNYTYQFENGIAVQAGYEKSWLGEVGVIMTPANPNQQPLNYSSDEVERDFIRLGAGYRF